jgi:hypothetical protein
MYTISVLVNIKGKCITFKLIEVFGYFYFPYSINETLYTQKHYYTGVGVHEMCKGKDLLTLVDNMPFLVMPSMRMGVI